MISLKMGGIIVAAFVAGAFVASPELRAYAANTIGSADIINESIQSVDIKNGQVKTADIAGSAVNSAKILDGTIVLTDVAQSFINVHHRDDCDCGGTGWDPDGQVKHLLVSDNRVTTKSVVLVSLNYQTSAYRSCTANVYGDGLFAVSCELPPQENAGLNVAILNPP